MSTNYRAPKTHTKPSRGHGSHLRQDQQTPRKASRGLPYGDVSTYSISGSQVGYPNNSYAVPETSIQYGLDSTASPAAMIGNPSGSISYSNIALDHSAYDDSSCSTALPAEYEAEAVDYTSSPSANYHSCAPDNTPNPYTIIGESTHYPVPPMSPSSVSYYPDDGYQTFGPNGGVAYTPGQGEYISPDAIDTIPMSTSPSNDMGDHSFDQALDPVSDRVRGRTGSGDSTIVNQGSIVGLAGHADEGDALGGTERMRVWFNNEQLMADHIEGYMNNDDPWTAENPQSFTF